MSQLQLTMATMRCDHMRDLADGTVRAEGIDLRVLSLDAEDIFFRFERFREFDVSEFSFAKYVAVRSQGTDDIIGLPVFPSRVFRQSSLYVRPDSEVKSPADLAGRRVGIPEWVQTAGVYVRGWLAEQVGVKLESVEWFQAGVNQSGRVESTTLQLPKGLHCTPVPDRTLNDMLLAGDLDALISARPPAAFATGELVRLIPNAQEMERALVRETGIFPIMHCIVIRTEVLDANPWVGTNLNRACEESRRNSLNRMRNAGASTLPLPWVPDIVRDATEAMGGDPFPYGVEANRATLDAFLRYCHDQGITTRAMTVEELFFPPTLAEVKS